MAPRTTRCENCGHRIHWNPKNKQGPAVFMAEGKCPNCEHQIQTPAP